jgi:hypothetical protein
LLLRQYRLPVWLLLPLLGLSIGGLWLNLNTLIGREGGAALLICCWASRVLNRVSSVIGKYCWPGFFLAAIPLLFDQSPLSALWLVISLLALTWAMLRLAGGAVQGTAGTAVQALLLSLPLMLVLFVVMPRLPGPLWSMPHEQHIASTGLSDSMEPGSISQLVQQQEPAFSVVFDGQPPAHEQLYWRIMILMILMADAGRTYMAGASSWQGEKRYGIALPASLPDHAYPCWITRWRHPQKEDWSRGAVQAG